MAKGNVFMAELLKRCIVRSKVLSLVVVWYQIIRWYRWVRRVCRLSAEYKSAELPQPYVGALAEYVLLTELQLFVQKVNPRWRLRRLWRDLGPSREPDRYHLLFQSAPMLSPDLVKLRKTAARILRPLRVPLPGGSLASIPAQDLEISGCEVIRENRHNLQDDSSSSP